MALFSSTCNIFNNREIAIGILLLAIIIFALTIRNIRKSFLGLVRKLLEIKILIFILVIAVYGFGIVQLLRIINYWDIYLLKDTILWYLLPGFIMGVKYITSKDDGNLFKKIIIDNIEFLIIFEFIVNFYVFPIWAEIIIIPIITFIVLLDVVASRDKKYTSVLKFLRTLQFLIGSLILVYSVYQIIKDFSNFGSINTLKEFLLPIILTITFIPLICFMVLYSRYEEFFIRLDFYYKNNKILRRHIKRRTIKNCLLNYNKIKLINLNWMNFKNNADVDIFFKSLK